MSMNDNGPVRGKRSDPGKGSAVRPPNDGTLVQDSYPAGDFSEVRGDSRALGRNDREGFDAGAPVWVEGMSVDVDAVNRLGACDGTDSDPMFDRFKHEATGNTDEILQAGSNAADSVASSSLSNPDADSSPMFQDTPPGDYQTPSSSDKD